MFVALSIMSSAWSPGTAQAQKDSIQSGAGYQLVQGKQYEMCRLYEQNLNRYRSEPPMVCERKVHPDFARQFSVPKWETLDPAAHMDIVAEMIRSRTPVIPVAQGCDDRCAAAWREKKWQEYKPKLLEEIKQGQVKLAMTRVDLNHDGKTELVYRLTEGDCIPKRGERYGSSGHTTLMVYDITTGKFNPAYAKYLGNRNYDVLLWRGRSHLTRWDDVLRDSSLLIYDTFRNDNPAPEIHLEFGVKQLPLCEFRYQGN